MLLEPDLEDEEKTELDVEGALTLEKVLQVMGPEDQAVLVAYYGYGYSLDEIASAMRKSRNAIRYRAGKALERARMALGIEGGDFDLGGNHRRGRGGNGARAGSEALQQRKGL